jgi:hypothetical protein
LPAGPRAFFGNRNPSVNEQDRNDIINNVPLPTQQDYIENPDMQPTTGNGMPAFTGNFSAGLNEPTQNQIPSEPSPEIQKSFQNNEKTYSSATPKQQQAYQNNLSSTTVPQGTNVAQFDFSNIKSLRNVIGIAAPVEKQIEVPESLTTTENAKGTSYVTKFNKKTTNDKVIEKSNELVLKSVPEALSWISGNETLSKYFSENDLGQLDIGAKVSQGPQGLDKEQKSYYIGVRGKKDSYTPITEDDYKNALMIRNLPASAKTLDSAFIISDNITPENIQQDFMGQMKSQFGEPQKPSATTPETPATPNVKQSEFSNTENPFYKRANQTPVSQRIGAGRGPKSTGPTFDEKKVKEIQDQIVSIDDRIKTIDSRRGSAQDKYRAYEMLKKEKDQLQSELSKYTK